MSFFTPCPRCQHGTLRVVTDMFDEYLQCLQCSREIPIPRDGETTPAPAEVATAENAA